MKDVVKTCILIGIVLLIGIVSLFIVGNFEYGVEMLTKNNLSYKDPTVTILYDRVKNNTELRKASLVNDELSSQDIIKFVLNNLNEEDYKKKNIKADKITCEVTESISFLTEKEKCKIYIIDNKVFDKYQKKYFNLEKELDFGEIEYKGYHCKNGGKKYYCLVNNYDNTVLGYSEFKGAYETKDSVVIHEYYLNINLEDKDYCLKYFDEDYCEDYLNKERIKIDKDRIIEDGVLYEHIFVKKDNNYYLEKSFIVSEG